MAVERGGSTTVKTKIFIRHQMVGKERNTEKIINKVCQKNLTKTYIYNSQNTITCYKSTRLKYNKIELR